MSHTDEDILEPTPPSPFGRNPALAFAAFGLSAAVFGAVGLLLLVAAWRESADGKPGVVAKTEDPPAATAATSTQVAATGPSTSPPPEPVPPLTNTSPAVSPATKSGSTVTLVGVVDMAGSPVQALGGFGEDTPPPEKLGWHMVLVLPDARLGLCTFKGAAPPALSRGWRVSVTGTFKQQNSQTVELIDCTWKNVPRR